MTDADIAELPDEEARQRATGYAKSHRAAVLARTADHSKRDLAIEAGVKAVDAGWSGTLAPLIAGGRNPQVVAHISLHHPTMYATSAMVRDWLAAKTMLQPTNEADDRQSLGVVAPAGLPYGWGSVSSGGYRKYDSQKVQDAVPTLPYYGNLPAGWAVAFKHGDEYYFSAGPSSTCATTWERPWTPWRGDWPSGCGARPDATGLKPGLIHWFYYDGSPLVTNARWTPIAGTADAE